MADISNTKTIATAGTLDETIVTSVKVDEKLESPGYLEGATPPELTSGSSGGISPIQQGVRKDDG